MVHHDFQLTTNGQAAFLRDWIEFYRQIFKSLNAVDPNMQNHDLNQLMILIVICS